jgi:hypothetical protein
MHTSNMATVVPIKTTLGADMFPVSTCRIVLLLHGGLLWSLKLSPTISLFPANFSVDCESYGKTEINLQNLHFISLRAGSRYEQHDSLGTAHVLRIAAGLTTKGSTQFGIMRNLQQIGASLSCQTDRETIAYTLQSTTDNL